DIFDYCMFEKGQIALDAAKGDKGRGLSQKYGDDEPVVIPLSGAYSRFPALITADNFPLFPFIEQFNTGIEINPANKVSLAGDINIPVPGWGNWDMDTNLYAGHINLDVKTGIQTSPRNPLKIKPETLALLAQNPAFRKARKEAKEVVVGRIPYGYEPIKCKPPYCNPFVHHTGVAVEVEQGDDTFFIGGLDFPVPTGEVGGVRLPFSGAVEYVLEEELHSLLGFPVVCISFNETEGL
ncbi:hypothetical protein TELCIR_08625, partial [Teladorsagia circumcincta]